MLSCDYCGKQNPPDALSCAGCGGTLNPLERKPAADAAATNSPDFKWIHLDQIAGAFTFEAGFSRPDWDRLWQYVERTVPPEERGTAWQEVLWQWLEQLRRDLGGDYRIHASDDFLLLGDLPRDAANRILSFAERVVTIARESLGHLAWRDDCGRHVILMFGDQDDYYQYVSWFFDADIMPSSAGVHLSQGAPHIAVQAGTPEGNCTVIAHELAHHCIAHLPVPLWLNEGVAQRLERAIAQHHTSEPLMSGEIAERHYAFWNEENIQAFWAGTLFHASRDAQELSYNLAEVLVHLLSEDRDAFLNFLSEANYVDAGQTAALDCLGRNLGDVVAGFLGEGHWRPIRKHLVACWDQQKSSSPDPDPS